MTYGVVYHARCRTSGKGYVGQTTMTVQSRWQTHVQSKKFVIGAAIRKYGPADFDVQELDTASNQDDLDRKERYWVEKLGTRIPHGYNLMDGGGSAGRHSPETREKMSRVKMGKTASVEAKANMSAAQKGRKRSAEACENNRLAQRGKKLPQETKEKMRAAHKGRVRPPEQVARTAATRRGVPLSQEARERIRVGCIERDIRARERKMRAASVDSSDRGTT
jgi:group I intron endonuclease